MAFFHSGPSTPMPASSFPSPINSAPSTNPTTPSSSRSPSPPLHRVPKIACFHGGGSNASIHRVQCAQLAAKLKGRLEFHFFDAPFISERAGPDVMPAFKDYAPFRSWVKPLNKAEPGSTAPPINTEEQEISAGVDDGSGYDPFGSEGLERVLEMMRYIAPAEEWVGALGFSQGTRVVGGLLADQEAREKLGWPKRSSLKFGVLCMGSRRPLNSEAQKAKLDPFGYGLPTMNDDNMEEDEDKISIPSIHLHGLKDMQLNNGRILKRKFYQQETSTLLEIDYHHAMPWHKKDVDGLLRLVEQVMPQTEKSRERFSYF